MFRVITQSMSVLLKENKSSSVDITLVWILNVAKGTGSGYRCVIDPGIVFQSCTVTNYHKSGGLRQQKLIPSQFWSPGVWNQGAGRDIQHPQPKDSRKNPSLPFLVSGVCWQSLSSGTKQQAQAWKCITPVPASGFTWPSPVCVYVSILLHQRHSARAPDSQHDLICADYICQDLSSKYKHIHRRQRPGLPLISLGTQSNP